MCTLSYETRLKALALERLELRRLRMDLATCYSIAYGRVSIPFSSFLALFAVACPSVCLSSVVCNARAPYSGGSNFRQYFYGIGYLGHPLTSTENFTEIVAWERLRRMS